MRRLSLGTAAALANVSKSTLSGWENGASRPRGAAFERLLDALEAEPRTRTRLLHAADPAFARSALIHSPLGAPVDVGTVVRAMRARRGMTQADLARRVGMTQSAVAHWEAGDAVPPAATLHAVGFALGATVEETLALASAQGGGQSGLPDDIEAAHHHLQCVKAAPDLRELVSLGQEAELWRRAALDARWDACLVRVLADRAGWLVGQERYDEIPVHARRAIAMARTAEDRSHSAGAVAALADHDRHRGAGHAAAAEMAGALAERIPDSGFRDWMFYQRGMSLARMGAGDEGAALVIRSTGMDGGPWDAESWCRHTSAQCDVRLAAGEPAKAAALIDGRREAHFSPTIYVRVEQANGRAATDADMAYLRVWAQCRLDTPHGRRSLERIERRQAKLTGGEPVPLAPGPLDSAKEGRLWAAVLREHRG